MQVIFLKRAGATDLVTCIRADGTRTAAEMPRQGILPHELFHFVVESTLNISRGLYGHVQSGAALHFTDAANPVHLDAADAIELAQAESLVECFQALEWGGEADFATFVDLLAVTCSTRNVASPALMQADVDRVRKAIGEMTAHWRALQPTDS